MEDFAHSVASFVREHQHWAAPIVLVLAFGESLAFISLLIPAWGALIAIGALIAAVLEASRWIDASDENKTKMVLTIAQKSYVNTTAKVIEGRILGQYEDGLGKAWKDPRPMRFFRDGQVNFPYLSDGMWFLTQHRRWGLLKSDPDYLAAAREVNRIDLCTQAAAQIRASLVHDVLDRVGEGRVVCVCTIAGRAAFSGGVIGSIR